jgi:hypothetical protein
MGVVGWVGGGTLGLETCSFQCACTDSNAQTPHGRRQLTRVNSINVLDEGLRIEEIGRRMNSKVKLVKQGVYQM